MMKYLLIFLILFSSFASAADDGTPLWTNNDSQAFVLGEGNEYFNDISAMAVDQNGYIYALTMHGDLLKIRSSDGVTIDTFSQYNDTDDEYWNAWADLSNVALSNSGGTLYYLDNLYLNAVDTSTMELQWRTLAVDVSDSDYCYGETLLVDDNDYIYVFRESSNSVKDSALIKVNSNGTIADTYTDLTHLDESTASIYNSFLTGTLSISPSGNYMGLVDFYVTSNVYEQNGWSRASFLDIQGDDITLYSNSTSVVARMNKNTYPAYTDSYFLTNNLFIDTMRPYEDAYFDYMKGYKVIDVTTGESTMFYNGTTMDTFLYNGITRDADDNVVATFASGDSLLSSFNADTGVKNWDVDFGEHAVSELFGTPIVDTNNYIYILPTLASTYTDGNVGGHMCIDGDTGEVVWFNQVAISPTDEAATASQMMAGQYAKCILENMVVMAWEGDIYAYEISGNPEFPAYRHTADEEIPIIPTYWNYQDWEYGNEGVIPEIINIIGGGGGKLTDNNRDEPEESESTEGNNQEDGIIDRIIDEIEDVIDDIRDAIGIDDGDDTKDDITEDDNFDDITYITNEEEEEEELIYIEEIPTTIAVNVEEVKQVNLLVMIFAYIGIFITKYRKVKDTITPTAILGSLICGVALTAMLIGFNPFLLNIFFGDSIIWGALTFLIYGIAVGRLTTKPKKHRK